MSNSAEELPCLEELDRLLKLLACEERDQLLEELLAAAPHGGDILLPSSAFSSSLALALSVGFFPGRVVGRKDRDPGIGSKGESKCGITPQPL